MAKQVLEAVLEALEILAWWEASIWRERKLLELIIDSLLTFLFNNLIDSNLGFFYFRNVIATLRERFIASGRFFPAGRMG